MLDIGKAENKIEKEKKRGSSLGLRLVFLELFELAPHPPYAPWGPQCTNLPHCRLCRQQRPIQISRILIEELGELVLGLHGFDASPAGDNLLQLSLLSLNLLDLLIDGIKRLCSLYHFFIYRRYNSSFDSLRTRHQIFDRMLVFAQKVLDKRHVLFSIQACLFDYLPQCDDGLSLVEELQKTMGIEFIEFAAFLFVFFRPIR